MYRYYSTVHFAKVENMEIGGDTNMAVPPTGTRRI